MIPSKIKIYYIIIKNFLKDNKIKVSINFP